MKLTLKDYLPIIYIYIFSLLITLNLTFFNSYLLRNSILVFLGTFSLIFAGLKFYNFKGFIDSFVEYDFISKKVILYAYIFPFFELLFGLSFLFQYEFWLIEFLCLAFFSINLISVLNALLKKQKFMCACLGGLFNVPLSYVSLLENITMIAGVLFLIITK